MFRFKWITPLFTSGVFSLFISFFFSKTHFYEAPLKLIVTLLMDGFIQICFESHHAVFFTPLPKSPDCLFVLMWHRWVSCKLYIVFLDLDSDARPCVFAQPSAHKRRSGLSLMLASEQFIIEFHCSCQISATNST